MGQFAVSWRGQVETWGLWFPPGWQQSTRLAGAWTVGCRLLQANQGLLLILPRVQRLQAEQAAALPVVAVGGGWASYRRARPQPGQLLLRWQGQLWAGAVSRLAEADLAALWDCEGWTYAEGQPLVSAISRPSVTVARPEEVRSILPAVPPPAPEQQRWLEQIRQPQPAAKPQKNLLLGFFDLLRSFFDSPDNQHYVAKMVRLFEEQNWHDALRYAIPIDNSLSGEQLKRFLGLLRPRANLDFTPRSLPGAAIGTSLDGLDMLKALYHKALQQLVQAGRIEEAAYVWAELLKDAAGAVNFLETHRRFEAAARLATLKGLPAALQVRLWFQAGHVEQAMVLARRYFVHSDAMIQLSAKDPALARQFRLAWAQDLARVGRSAEALSVGWEVREQLPDYDAWLEQALDAGGAGAVQAMGQCLHDDALRQRLGLCARLQAWFADDEALTHERRRQLLERLAQHPFHTSDEVLQDWAQRTARRLMRQANSPFPLGSHAALSYLIHLSNDPWLRADRPPTLPDVKLRLGLWRETVEENGHTPVWDAALLGDGRMLVALGHAGLVVLSTAGAFSQRFATPAHQIVSPRDGERYLAISGERISSYQQGRVEAWCSAHMDGFADHHDGYHWLVWLGDQLYQVDLTQPGEWRAVTLVRLPGAIRSLALGPRHLGILTEKGMVFFYDYPSLRLATSADGTPGDAAQVLTPMGLERFQVKGVHLHYKGVLLHLQGQQPRAFCQENYCLVQSSWGEGISLLIFHLDRPTDQFLLNLPQSGRVTTRIQGHQLTVCDNRGRLLVADLHARQWLRQHFL